MTVCSGYSSPSLVPLTNRLQLKSPGCMAKPKVTFPRPEVACFCLVSQWCSCGFSTVHVPSLFLLGRVLVGPSVVSNGMCTWGLGLCLPLLSLGTEAEAQEEPRIMELVLHKVCIPALLQPLRMLLTLPRVWGCSGLTLSLLTPECRVPWLSTHKSFCVQT